MKKKFITFSDKKFEPSRKRITCEAESFAIFDEIYSLDENFFDKRFKSFFSEGNKKFHRGYGYWSWKSYCINRILKECQDGDIIFYADAGCHLNIDGKDRLLQYIELLESNNLIVFNQDHVEECYTKEDVFRYLNVEYGSEIRTSTQFYAGFIILKANNQTRIMIEKWQEVCQNHYYLITDSPSISPNCQSFIEHRHDQSVFSILAKQFGCLVIPSIETYPTNGDWSSMTKYPIWACRDKKMTLFQKFVQRLMKPYRIYLQYKIKN